MTEQISEQKRPGPGRPPAIKKNPEQAGQVQTRPPQKKHGSQEQERVMPKYPVSLVSWQSRVPLFVGIMACLLLLTLLIVLLSGNLGWVSVGSNISDVMPTLEVEAKEPDLQATVEALQAQIEGGTLTPLVELGQAIKTVEERPCLRLPAENVSLGNFGEANIFVDAQKGETTTFSHCPPEASIKYELLAVDDEIEKVEVTCSTGVTEITGLFTRVETTELLPHYQSQTIDLEGDCRIDFTVKDIHGGQMGIIFKKSNNAAFDPVRFVSKGGVPDGSTYTIEVSPGELHIFTAGPVCVWETCLSGGETRGSVIVMKSLDTSYSVDLSGLVAYSNWYGAYKASPESWESLIDSTVDSMRKPGNCTNGKGCEVVDLLIIDGGSIVQSEVR